MMDNFNKAKKVVVILVLVFLLTRITVYPIVDIRSLHQNCFEK